MVSFQQTRDIVWGIEIYLAIVVGLVVSSLRFRIIRSESNRSLHKYEKIFLFLLIFLAFGTFVYMAGIANMMLFDRPLKELADTLAAIVSIIAFWMVFVENYFMQKGSKTKFTKMQKAIINILTMFYVSSGIGACWNALMFNIFKEINTPLDSLAIIFLCLMILLPFQRHFWLEVMLGSKSIKDNVLVIAALIITVILAVLPVHIVNLL
ncbi:MAG: hypothetical protein JXJ04_17685 [Spirochaetales bacterium]|nr:hypothetical protein [Spirochaetales bacterium]